MAAVSLSGGGNFARAQTITPAQAREIAKEITIYGFPMVDSYRVQHAYFVDESHPEYKAPWNTLKNVLKPYSPDDRAVQAVNTDVPSHSWERTFGLNR